MQQQQQQGQNGGWYPPPPAAGGQQAQMPPQGFPPQGYPPQGYPPQGYPPQGYPPQGYPPQGYPPQGYPPPAGPPGAQQGWPGQQPPQNGPSGYPQQGYPPPQGQYGYQPPPYGYPGAGYQAPQAPNAVWYPPAEIAYIAPSPGYANWPVQIPTYQPGEAVQDINILVKAFSKANTDEDAINNTLKRRYAPLECQLRVQEYRNAHRGKELVDVVNTKVLNFSGGYKTLVHALVGGGLELDCTVLRNAIKGIGTNEAHLDFILLGRLNEDVKAIKAHYEAKHRVPLQRDLEGDLSGDVLQLYTAVLAADRRWEPAAALPQAELQANVKELYAALTGRTNIATVIKYFVAASEHRLRSIRDAWAAVTGDQSLKLRLERHFVAGGHLCAALQHILAMLDRPSHDAQYLEQAFAFKVGKAEEIALRMAKILWENDMRGENDKFINGVNDYFKAKAGRTEGSLMKEIKANTSGHQRDLLLAILATKFKK
ncbi:hypothetical protein DFH27DRAFT_479293 [Peziza echinospora]|nr:hypothetical protein DFH27DRAFT_479293 [Peziza echinospora]